MAQNDRDPRCSASDAIKNKNDSVKVHVGRYNSREFKIPRRIVGATSKVLNSAFCVHPYENSLNLLREDPDLFIVYEHWMYTGKLATKRPDKDKSNTSKETEPSTLIKLVKKQGEYRILTDLYLFAKRIKDDEFGNAIIDGFIGRFYEVEREVSLSKDDNALTLPCQNTIGEIFHGSRSDITVELRKLVVQLYVRGNSEAVMKRCMLKSFAGGFQEDLVKALLAARTVPGIRTLTIDNCEFHTHAEDETCIASGSRKRKRSMALTTPREQDGALTNSGPRTGNGESSKSVEESI